MKQEASKSDRNLSFCGPFLHQLHPSQAEFTKLDNFLAAVELLEKPQFFGYLFDSPMTGALPIVGEPLLIGQPPGPGGQPVGQTLSVFALDNLALQTIPEPATLLTFGAAASFLLGFRRRAR